MVVPWTMLSRAPMELRHRAVWAMREHDTLERRSAEKPEHERNWSLLREHLERIRTVSI
jgi:hypothetical protein